MVLEKARLILPEREVRWGNIRDARLELFGVDALIVPMGWQKYDTGLVTTTTGAMLSGSILRGYHPGRRRVPRTDVTDGTSPPRGRSAATSLNRTSGEALVVANPRLLRTALVDIQT